MSRYIITVKDNTGTLQTTTYYSEDFDDRIPEVESVTAEIASALTQYASRPGLTIDLETAEYEPYGIDADHRNGLGMYWFTTDTLTLTVGSEESTPCIVCGEPHPFTRCPNPDCPLNT